jgi:A/G-specific adenine glycosylase
VTPRQARHRKREPLTRRRFVTRLFSWHAGAVRSLLVREAATPWEVLVVEVMSHQTQIGRVGLAWRRFVDTAPSPAALADASTRDLLAAWAGLGYNRRALALREAARRIVSDNAGEVPDSVADLEALPGIGPYTARAIAATAFGKPVAPLDVNVRRVMSRVTGIDPGSRDLQAAADHLVDRRDPRRWVNAVMDLASSVCTTTAPRCLACPVFGPCASRGNVPVEGGRRPPRPFPQTTRWLRGRLVASLTDAPAETWVPLPEGLGTHDRAAVVAAAEGLERDGFLELIDGRARLRP